jgi:Rrf2 family protein
MKVSNKCDYGLRALIELAHRYGEPRPIQSSEIAARQRVPESYLEQLLTVLRRAGFIRSVRGPQGGHALLRDPREIRVAEVVEVLEGPIVPIDCLGEGANGLGCAQTEMWADVRDAVLGVLNNVTIADLAQRDRSAQPAGARYII